MRPIPAISVRQPWANALLLSKTVENRTWKTTYRGLVYLHASKGLDWGGVDFILSLGLDPPPASPRGAIIGAFELDGICSAGFEGRPCDCGDWAMFGQHHWKRTNPVALPEPVPCKGSLGLWTPAPDVDAAVRDQLVLSRRTG